MTLKRARRSAQATAKIKAANQPSDLFSCKLQKYSSRAGATPKSTKSARESSSAPKRDEPSNARAIRPSSPSRIAATTIAMTAVSNWPSEASRIAVNPRHKASNVTRLGTTKRSGMPRNRRRLLTAVESARLSLPMSRVPPSSFMAHAVLWLRRGSWLRRSASTVSPATVLAPNPISGSTTPGI